MTDSGFSSAASCRSNSSIIKSSLINPMSDHKRIHRNVLGTHNSNIPIKADNTALPKPVLQNCKSGRPIIPNRLLYGNNNGGYSPIASPLCSFNESGLSNCLSPMSSLAIDFCELNTSQENSETPRRRLSLSSVSSVDSPCTAGFNGLGSFHGFKSSPLSTSINMAFNAQKSHNDCSTPISGRTDNKENVFVQSGNKNGSLQRYKSLPVGKFARDRLNGNSNHKENAPFPNIKESEVFSPIISPVTSQGEDKPCKPSPIKATGTSPSANLSISPNKKRFRDETIESAFSNARKRSKCSVSLNAKSAFLKERKTKSADAITRRPVPIIASSPISKCHTLSRSVSAPPHSIPDDDDIVLSHSSLCSGDSDDEDKCSKEGIVGLSGSSQDSDSFMDAICATSDSPAKDVPTGIDGLISGKLLFVKNKDESNNSSLMDSSLVSSNPDLKPRELFRSPSAPPLTSTRRALLATKRPVKPNPSDCDTPISYKRRKSVADFGLISMMENKENEEATAASFLNRSRSASDFEIMRAVEQGCTSNDLVGDFSRKCTIPTVKGHHQDLKYICRETLVDMLQSDEHDVDILDCRYTYEYEGGHIKSAKNIYTETQMHEIYFDTEFLKNKGKKIIVLHCEFSSERGPRMARALRNYDRSVNHYPKLYYPEIYVLHSGYKAFYQTCKNYCEPENYVPMLEKKYEEELRKFRVKSKTWAGEKSKHSLMKRLQKHR